MVITIYGPLVLGNGVYGPRAQHKYSFRIKYWGVEEFANGMVRVIEMPCWQQEWEINLIKSDVLGVYLKPIRNLKNIWNYDRDLNYR